MDLYAEEIISHYEHPHNKGKLENPTAQLHQNNPLCGDELTIYLDIKGGKVAGAKFDGTGCAISMATASMLTDMLKGKSMKEIEAMDVRTVIDLLGIDPGPARLKCATLSLKTAKGAVFLYEHKAPDKSMRDL